MRPFASVIDEGPEGPIVAIGGLMWVDAHHRNVFSLSNQEIAQEHGKTTVVFLKKKVARPVERLPSMIVQYEFAIEYHAKMDSVPQIPRDFKCFLL